MMAERLRFDCGQCGSFMVFAVYSRFPAVMCGVINNADEKNGCVTVSSVV